jgi:ribosome-associated protein
VADTLRVGRLSIPLSEVRFRFARSSGPGGQNVNKRETQVELIFDVAGSPSLGPRQRERVMRKLASRIDAEGRLRLVATEQRTQGRNREVALERLRDLLAEALKPDPPKRRASRPSKAAVQRRLDEKKIRSRRKQERSWRDED